MAIDNGLALKQDGSIVGWGSNNYGQASPPDGNDYVAIAVGAYHSLALRQDGSAVGWGRNTNSLGDYIGQAAPPDSYKFEAIAAGGNHSLGLVSTGPNLMAWWRFDDGAGVIAKDSCFNGYDGILYGEPNWAAGQLTFDGIDDVVELPIG